jgi:hypothetical protein
VNWLRRALAWLFPPPVALLLRQANEHGRVSLNEVQLGKRKGWGWYAAIRPEQVRSGPSSHRYQWTGQGATLEGALSDAIEEAKTFPIMVPMIVDTCAPKLGGAEFDEE